MIWFFRECRECRLLQMVCIYAKSSWNSSLHKQCGSPHLLHSQVVRSFKNARPMLFAFSVINLVGPSLSHNEDEF